MEIDRFNKAAEIRSELSILKCAEHAMILMDDCGQAPCFDISVLPKDIKEKIKPIFSERIEQLEKEFEEL